MKVWTPLHEHIGWNEWHSVEALLLVLLHKKRGLPPFEVMRERLHSDEWYQEWAAMKDPNWPEEQYRDQFANN